MKRPWLTLILLLSSSLMLAQTHEILRPTVDSDLANDLNGTCSGSSRKTSTAMANAYDAAGLSTSSSQSVFGIGGPSPTDRWTARAFTNWSSTANTYSTLTVNANSSNGVDINGNGIAGMAYSTNGGATWTLLTSGTNWNQATFTATISSAQNLANLQVAICVNAFGELDGPGGSDSMTVWDIWTDGTFSAPTPTPTPALNPVLPAVPSPVIVSRLWAIPPAFLLGIIIIKRRWRE